MFDLYMFAIYFCFQKAKMHPRVRQSVYLIFFVTTGMVVMVTSNVHSLCVLCSTYVAALIDNVPAKFINCHIIPTQECNFK